MLMADLGADVIKVEAATGDKMRHVERVFASCQRGKRGVALDLKSPAARPGGCLTDPDEASTVIPTS